MTNNDLERFKKAHELDFTTALAEIRNGRKVSHWMWYIFPQLAVFGRPDNMKLRSSMTLFAKASDSDIFQKVLEKYFEGKMDGRTVKMLQK